MKPPSLRSRLKSAVEPLEPRIAPATLTVDANKSEALTRDASQRSRMFLYAALGSVAAIVTRAGAISIPVKPMLARLPKV